MKVSASWMTVLGVVALGSLGCSGIVEKAQRKVADEAAEKAIEAASGGDVEIEGETVRIQDGDQTLAMGAGAKMPENWPSTVPVYPGAQVAMSSTDATPGSTGMMAVLQTPDAADKVVAFYKSHCAGCTVQTEVDAAGQGKTVIFTLPKPPGGSLSLSAFGDAGQPTSISLAISK